MTNTLKQYQESSCEREENENNSGCFKYVARVERKLQNEFEVMFYKFCIGE